MNALIEGTSEILSGSREQKEADLVVRAQFEVAGVEARHPGGPGRVVDQQFVAAEAGAAGRLQASAAGRRNCFGHIDRGVSARRPLD